MSHITEFSIIGLCGRKNTITYELNRDVNVFFGLNGSGKTSLLKILHSAMSDDTAILKNVPFKSAEVKIYSLLSQKIHIKTIDSNSLSTPSKSVFSDPGLIIFDEDEYEVVNNKTRSKSEWITKPKPPKDGSGGWSHRYLPTSRLYVGGSFRRHMSPSPLISEEELDLHFSRTLQHIWSNYSSEILRAVRKAQEDGLANILKAVLSPTIEGTVSQVVDMETAFTRASAFLKRQGSFSIIGSREEFEKRYKNDEQLRSIVGDINEVEKRIEQAMIPRSRLQHLIERMFTGNKSVKFSDTSIDIVAADDTPIGLHTLSSGEKHLIRILIETLLAEESSALIDEPEISMHIDWQRDLIEAMRHLNPHAQLILATHSPEIMADLDDSKIFRI